MVKKGVFRELELERTCSSFAAPHLLNSSEVEQTAVNRKAAGSNPAWEGRKST